MKPQKNILVLLFSFGLIVNPSQSQTWVVQNSGVTFPLLNIQMLDSLNGYASGYYGTILRTTNSGTNWASMQSPVVKFHIYSCYFTSAGTGWITTFDDTPLQEEYFGYIYKTTDSGNSWTEQYREVASFSSSYFVSSSTGFITRGTSGQGGTVLKTTNGGINWAVKYISSSAFFRAIKFISSLTGWVAGSSRAIYKTTNGGENWFVQSSGTNTLRSIYLISADTGWAAGDNGTILRTTNGGTNWLSQSIPTGFEFNSVYFINGQTGFVGGEYGKLYHTTNSGVTWADVPAITTFQIHSIQFISPNTGWIVGEFGRIFKTTNGGVNTFK